MDPGRNRFWESSGSAGASWLEVLRRLSGWAAGDSSSSSSATEKWVTPCLLEKPSSVKWATTYNAKVKEHVKSFCVLMMYDKYARGQPESVTSFASVFCSSMVEHTTNVRKDTGTQICTYIFTFGRIRISNRQLWIFRRLYTLLLTISSNTRQNFRRFPWTGTNVTRSLSLRPGSYANLIAAEIFQNLSENFQTWPEHKTNITFPFWPFSTWLLQNTSGILVIKNIHTKWVVGRNLLRLTHIE